jgi:hypothetical protein
LHPAQIQTESFRNRDRRSQGLRVPAAVARWEAGRRDDGTHFIFLQGVDAGQLVVVSNWDAVVRARMNATH